MTKQTYQLVNPVIEGTFKDTFDAKKPIEAANKMWTSFSEHLVNHVPKFMFTLKEISGGSLHHFQVTENGETNTYVIDKLNVDTDDKHFDELMSSIDKYSSARDNQQGGKDNDSSSEDKPKKHGHRKRYDDSSSDSSSSTDIYPTIRRTSPIAMFHYNTRVYYPTYKSTLNPQLVSVTTPLFTPIFNPLYRTFVGIWP